MIADYFPVIVVAVICIGTIVLLVLINWLFGPKRYTDVKMSPFECGIPQITNPHKRFNVKFYLVALIFIIFDIEAVFIFPWAVLYKEFLSDPAWALTALVEMLIFVGILVLALLYVWKRRALEWE